MQKFLIAAFAAVICITFIIIVDLRNEIHGYEAHIEMLNERVEEWEAEISGVREQNEELAVDYALLREGYEDLESKNRALERELKIYENERGSYTDNLAGIAATIAELERQNGDLSKKYDGLSKPD